MAPTTGLDLAADRAGTVRARLLTALHTGRLRPGDRVPSVRRLAGLAGINHKTVHRAYTELAREGILEVRPGSGTFVADRRAGDDSLPAATELVHAVRRVRTEAERLGLDPSTLASLVHACLTGSFADLTVGVVECNLEQIATIGADLDRCFGVRVKPIPLPVLDRGPLEAVQGVSSVVTTDCHWSEVAALLRPHGVPVHSVALDAEFPRRVLRLAAHHEVVLIARDPGFGPVFARLLRQLTDEPGVLGRIRTVDERTAPHMLRACAPGTWVYRSLLVRRGALPSHVRGLGADWHVAPNALETLRVGLAMDRILRRTA